MEVKAPMGGCMCERTVLTILLEDGGGSEGKKKKWETPKEVPLPQEYFDRGLAIARTDGYNGGGCEGNGGGHERP